MKETTIVSSIERAARQIVVVSAGVSTPSSTRLLADRLATRTVDVLGSTGVAAVAGVIELAPLASDIARALTVGFAGPELENAFARLREADGIIAVTPVYKAGPSGLFKSFFDLIDDDALLTTPVLLGATAGTSRHALVIDQQMRPLFAYLRALTAPTSVFAASEDWNAPEFTGRIDRAAAELAQLVAADLSHAITAQAWEKYRHDDSKNTTTTRIHNGDIDFDSPLMRLATGR